jgi:hypothetical protein
MCGVAPRVLAAVEAGTGGPTVETLEKLLRPFGYRVGVVRVAEGWDATDKMTSELEETPAAKTVESALTRALRGRNPNPPRKYLDADVCISPHPRQRRVSRADQEPGAQR